MYEQDETAEMQAMVRSFVTIGIEAINQLTGPLGDFVRALSNATVDAQVDARQRYIDAGWPEELADAVILATVQRNIELGKQIAQSIKEAQAKRASS